MPIVHSDNDIPALLDANPSMVQLSGAAATVPAPDVRHVVDLFVAARSAVHMLRAIEPQLRHGGRLRRVAATAELTVCPLAGGQRNERCVHVAARKHVGDALVRWVEEEELQRSRGGAS